MLSTIDRAIANLWRLTKGHVSARDADVLVVDGPTVEDVGNDVIVIGTTVDELYTNSSVMDAGLAAREEDFDLMCMATSWTGDDDMSARRTRAFEMVSWVAQVIQNDETLGGAVTRARIAGFQYLPSQLPEGAVATVSFRVRINAFTS